MAMLDEHDQLLAQAAHELRHPVTAIKGFADTLARARDRLTPEQQEAALEAICRQAGRLDRLLGDMLLVAVGTSGALVLRPVDVALGPAIVDAATDAGLRIDDVAVRCPAGATAWVDPDRLAQMLCNHLLNARLHGRPPVTVDVTRVPGFVEIAIGDAGDGVDVDLVARLYGRFQRAGRMGSGLGLAVVRTLAEASGGSDDYRPGRGGTHAFVLRLPVAAA